MVDSPRLDTLPEDLLRHSLLPMLCLRCGGGGRKWMQETETRITLADEFGNAVAASEEHLARHRPRLHTLPSSAFSTSSRKVSASALSSRGLTTPSQSKGGDALLPS